MARDMPARLAELNDAVSKHAGYQSLPDFVSSALGVEFSIDQEWRGDRNRYRVIEELLPGTTSVTDIGANSGFFSLSIAHDHATPVVAFEPNPEHAQIIELVAREFDLPVTVKARGVDLAAAGDVDGDLILLLNVLHHAGREFDKDEVQDASDVLPHAQRYLEMLRRPGRRMLWQIGYRWGGDRSTPIVEPDQPALFLQLQLDVMAGAGWTVDRVLYPRRQGGAIVYCDVSPAAVHDVLASGGEDAVAKALGIDEAIGEFHRRALLVCSST